LPFGLELLNANYQELEDGQKELRMHINN